MAAPKLKPRPWSNNEIARLVELREIARLTWPRIDDLLHRSHGQSASRYAHEMA
jgi:hypothetical protein